MRTIILLTRVKRQFVCVSYIGKGPCPMQLVVVTAVRKAVRAATMTFTATSMILFFFIIISFSG